MSAPLPLPATPAADPWRAADAGAFVAELPDLGMLSFSGPDAAAFLHAQLSSDVKALPAGAGQRSTYNSPKGRVLATLFVARPPATDGRYEALLAADLAEALGRRLAMFVLRAKVAVADETSAWGRFGVGGPAAAAAVDAALGTVPPPGGVAERGGVRIAHLPEGRFVVLAPLPAAGAVAEALRGHATPAPPDVWHWVGVRAGVPRVTAATQDLFVPQAANQDALGGLDFRKGCYPGQEVVARTQYLGRLKERLFLLATPAPPPPAGTRLYSPAFGDQACGTVVESVARPGTPALLLAVMQTEAAAGAIAIAAPDGPAATPEPLPYALPEPAQPPGRVKL